MKKTKSKPNKYAVYVLSIIISLILLIIGFQLGLEIATMSAIIFSASIAAILFISGLFLKKTIRWLPVTIGTGMAIFVLQAMLSGGKLW